jgi:CheY-like chemotaxis protein
MMDEGSDATVLVAARRETRLPLNPQEHGVVVIRTDTGEGAITLAREAAPAVVVVDVTLPDTSGLDLCRRLREDPMVDRSTPILVLTTTQPSAEQRVAALRSGAWGFVQLPAHEGEFVLKVRHYAEAKRHFDDAAAAERYDASAGIHTAAGLVRKAQRLGALMYRVHAGLACVVFEVGGAPATSRVAAAIAGTARSADVVGILGYGRIAVVAPATDPGGAVALAVRVGDSARRAMLEQAAEESSDSRSRLLVGYDAVANARYSPVDPVRMIRNASFAVHNGRVEPGSVWIRGAETVTNEAGTDWGRLASIPFRKTP